LKMVEQAPDGSPKNMFLSIKTAENGKPAGSTVCSQMPVDINSIIAMAQKSRNGTGSILNNLTTSITMSMLDEDGTRCSIQHNGDNLHLTITDKDQKVIFDGPYTTDQEKAKVPAKYRDKISEIEKVTDADSALKAHMAHEHSRDVKKTK
jgi:hypothetical protein